MSMFGTSSGGNGSGSNGLAPRRPLASEVARIDSNLTHVLVSPDRTDGLAVFTNARPLAPGELESLSLEIIAPDERGANGSITAILARHQVDMNGTRTGGQQSTSLFPGTVEVMARNRRIVVTCQDDGSFDGLWLGLGMRGDGTTTELSGVKSLRVVVSPDLVDARLIWAEDGTEEDLLPDA